MDKKRFEVGIAYTNFDVLRIVISIPPSEINPDATNTRPLLRTHMSPDVENERVTVLLSAKITYKDDDRAFDIIEAFTRSTFLVQGMSQFEHDDNGVELPDELAATLLSTSYATTRGAILGRGAGMIADDFILPLVKPQFLLSSLKAEIDMVE